MNKQELINKLPTSWSDVSLNQYIELMEVLPLLPEGVVMDEKYLNRLVSIWFKHFTGLRMDECDYNVLEVMDVINKMNAFLETKEQPAIDVNELKKIDELSYDEFITLIKLQEANTLKNYPSMINIILKQPIDDIGNKMNMATANSFFLLLQKQLIEFINHSQTCLTQKMLKM